MNTRHVAIIGCGAIHTCHVDALRHVPGVVLRAIVDSDSAKGSQLAANYGCHFYQDYREMLLDDAIDVVHICTPHYLHKPMILAALAAGKQVFCEKPVVMNPQDANSEFIRGNVELVRISEAQGRIAAEGALPYPPGVLCVVPGEIWGGAVQRYFLALEEGVNLLPGFSPELQGVYSEKDADGISRLFGYVLK